MRRFLLASAALFFSAPAMAGNAQLMPPPWDPGNAIGMINSWIQNQLNPFTPGVVATLPAPVATSAATIQTLFSYTIPAGALQTGQTFHIKAYGVNDSNADARTLTFSFGASTCALTVTGTSANWDADLWVTETGPATQTSECVGRQGTSSLAPVQATSWTVSNTGNIAVLVEGTAATAGIMTLNESWADFIR